MQEKIASQFPIQLESILGKLKIDSRTWRRMFNDEGRPAEAIKSCIHSLCELASENELDFPLDYARDTEPMPEIDTTVLQCFMSELDWTVAELAHNSGLDGQTIQRMITKKRTTQKRFLAIRGALTAAPSFPAMEAKLCTNSIHELEGNKPGGSSESRPIVDYSALVKRMLPFRPNPFFSGRKELLSKISNAIRFETSHLVALTGLGGIGKTQLASEFANRWATDFDPVFWISADTTLELQNGFLQIANQLNLLTDNMRLELALQSVRRWLSQNSNWLLIIDNADDPGIVRSFLPQPISGRIILTSRSQFLDALEPVTKIDIDEFSVEESIEFLGLRTKIQIRGSEKNAVEAIHRELAGLPLALEQAAAYVAEKKIGSFVPYLAEYRNRRTELLNSQMPRTGGYPHSVATTWHLNFLEVKQAFPEAVDLMRFTAFLRDSTSIPFDYIRNAIDFLPDSLKEFLSRASAFDLAILETLSYLERYSLVRVDPAARSYTMHLLVREVIKDLDEP